MQRAVVFLVFVFGVCRGTHIRYPLAGSPCVLLDVTATYSLVWTDKDGKEAMVPTWSFADSSVHNGDCPPSPFVEVRWTDSGAFQYTFSNVNGMVELSIEFSIIPNFIPAFTNSTDAVRISASQKIQLGSADRAYECYDLMPIKLEMVGGDNNKYEAVLHFMAFKAQGFNVKDGTYAKAEDCDSITTEPPQSITTPESLTTEHEWATTQPTTLSPSSSHTSSNSMTTQAGPTPIPPFPPGRHPRLTLRVGEGHNNCVYMIGEFLFAIPYIKKDYTSGTVSLGLQDIVSTSGACAFSNFTNTLTVDFLRGWRMTITFSTDGSNLFWWSEVNLQYIYDAEIMPGLIPNMEGMSGYATTNQSLFKASIGGSYLCNTATTVKMDRGVSLTTFYLQYDAFYIGANQTSFPGDTTTCDADRTSDVTVILGISCGCVGLVLLIIISVYVWRRRRRLKNFERTPLIAVNSEEKARTPAYADTEGPFRSYGVRLVVN